MLKKYTNKCGKISSLMIKEFDSEPVYGDSDQYVKAKIKSYTDKINTSFQRKKISKENTSCTFLSLIIVDSVFNVGKKYYPQTLLEECKYEIKKNKMDNLINDDVKPSSSDSESDNESNNESDSESNTISDNEPSNLFVEN